MYLQLMEQIRRRIAVGDWTPGQEIPSIRALAATAQVSVITVKRAYSELEREGVIVTRQGKGSFVSANADLGSSLQYQELEDRLAGIANLASDLGIGTDELEERLRQARLKARKEQS